LNGVIETTSKRFTSLTPGDRVPEFEAQSTYGTIRLQDYQDKWVVLFWRPTDFCPTWANQITRFAEIFCELRKLNCELIGIGGPDDHSPLMWSRAMRDQIGVKIWFPVILDPLHQLAKNLGTIGPDHEAAGVSHTIYIIDDKQILRAIVHYDTVAPNTLDELVRLINLLQKSSVCGMVTPESWRPGDEWILEQTPEESNSDENRYEMWYF